MIVTNELNNEDGDGGYKIHVTPTGSASSSADDEGSDDSAHSNGSAQRLALRQTHTGNSQKSKTSMDVEHGDQSPIPVSMRGTPQCGSPYSPFEEEEEAKQARPSAKMQGIEDIDLFDEIPSDEEDDDDDEPEPTQPPQHEQEVSTNTKMEQYTKRLTKRLSNRVVTDKRYGSSEMFSDQEMSPPAYSPVSVSHQQGYDVHLDPARIETESESSDQFNSSATTDHALSMSDQDSIGDENDRPPVHLPPDDSETVPQSHGMLLNLY